MKYSFNFGNAKSFKEDEMYEFNPPRLCRVLVPSLTVTRDENPNSEVLGQLMKNSVVAVVRRSGKRIEIEDPQGWAWYRTEKGNHKCLQQIRQQYEEVRDAELYFEQQESLLCGRHCLNNLLQGPYFDSDSLWKIADELHEKEQMLLLERQQTLTNHYGDDSGMFNINVLELALRKEGLEMSLVLDRKSLKSGNAFIINKNQHWFCLRKIFGTWLLLDSLEKFEGEGAQPVEFSKDSAFMRLEEYLDEGAQLFIVKDLPEEPFQICSKKDLPFGKYLNLEKDIKDEPYYLSNKARLVASDSVDSGHSVDPVSEQRFEKRKSRYQRQDSEDGVWC